MLSSSDRQPRDKICPSMDALSCRWTVIERLNYLYLAMEAKLSQPDVRQTVCFTQQLLCD
ncbi:hypothetical protein DY000_02009173 [Brassica cretica]|uniref:Uncharacterized protein n=1 Tax=Brassica cretica TaxID=69181 RepID=A0ABQ7C2E9_BRACR|nr:hypothetical protein DY000_02009173 [Brassica cretica]